MLVVQEQKYYNEHIEKAMQWCVPRHSFIFFILRYIEPLMTFKQLQENKHGFCEG